MPLPSRVSDLTGFDLLLSVARTGSIGRAAAEHGVSQPAASARMRLLEGQLGLALIERSPRGSTLTPAGALAGWAQAAVDAAAAVDAGVAALRRERDSRFPIAASMTVAEYLLPAWLTALRAIDPGAVVALSAVNSADVAHAIGAGTAEIGFVEGPAIPGSLHAEPVGRDTLTLVVAPAHPWARRRSGVPAAELARTALVSREAGSGTRGYLEEALRAQAGLERVPPAAELSSTTAIKAAVAAGAGPAVLSSLAVAAELAAGTLRAVPVTGVDLTRTLRAVWPEGRRLTGPALDLYTIAARTGRRLLPCERSHHHHRTRTYAVHRACAATRLPRRCRRPAGRASQHHASRGSLMSHQPHS
jgi:DNA-binding transcriptional LysR family regulator